MSTWKWCARSVLAAMVLPCLASAAQALDVQFANNQVVVTGLQSGNRVAFLASVRTFADYAMTVRTVSSLVTDADNDGAIAYDFGEPIPEASIWAAVEVETGAWDVEMPLAEDKQQIPFPQGGLSTQAGGSANDLLSYPANEVLALWVRPAADSAFRFLNADGGVSDFDTLVDAVSTSLAADAEPLTLSSDAPTSFAAGDVLVVIDPQSFQFSATTVP